MTWFGWLIVADMAVSLLMFIATNDERKPLTQRQLAGKVAMHAAYIAGFLLIGTGSL